MSWLNLPDEIKAALAQPITTPADLPDASQDDKADDSTSGEAPAFPNSVSYEDWYRERMWSIRAAPWQ